MPLIRDFGFAPGRLPPGPRNTLADLPGVTVGTTPSAAAATTPA